jgi:YD repeat-containing protein
VQAAYDAANEQIQFNAASPNQTFDAKGNLTGETGPTGSTVYTWDARNRLVAQTVSCPT